MWEKYCGPEDQFYCHRNSPQHHCCSPRRTWKGMQVANKSMRSLLVLMCSYKNKEGSPKNALRSSHVIKWNKKLCNICKFHGIQAISGGALWVCTMHTWQNSTQTKNSGGMCLHYTQAVPLMTETCSPGRAHCFVSLVISPSPSPRDQHIVLFLVISPWKQDTGQ